LSPPKNEEMDIEKKSPRLPNGKQTAIESEEEKDKLALEEDAPPVEKKKRRGRWAKKNLQNLQVEEEKAEVAPQKSPKKSSTKTAAAEKPSKNKQPVQEIVHLDKSTFYYFAKIKELNSLITTNLLKRFDKLPIPSTSDDSDSSFLSDSPRGKNGFTKRRRSFEDEIFDDYENNIKTMLEENPYLISERLPANNDLIVKIRNIKFEVSKESDTHPILKKLKKSEKKV